MRDRNSTLGKAAITVLMNARAMRKAAFEGPGTRIPEPKHKARDRERAAREAEAATWIAEVRARKSTP